MKFKEIQTKIIVPSDIVFDDGLFDDNICPSCGHNIKNIKPCKNKKDNFWGTINYRDVCLKCPECNCEFYKKINDNFQWRNKVDLFRDIFAIFAFLSAICLLIFMFLICLEILNKIFIIIPLSILIIFAIFSQIFDNLGE